jgi:hypothetical protein
MIMLAACESQEINSNDNPDDPIAGNLTFEHIVVDSDNPPNPHCKTVGDINGDNFPDILAASSGNNATGLFWYEYPNWSKHQIASGSFTTDMQVGDVDNDGDMDVIIPRGISGGSTVHWFENPRPGGSPAQDVWTEHDIGTADAHDVEVADLNRDNKLDVVVRLFDVSVLIQDSPTTWTNVPISAGGRAGLALVDINNDNRTDIVMDGFWLMAPADPASGTWQKFVFADGWEGKDVGVTPHDLNNDNRVDILIAPAESEGQLVWYESSDDPTDKDQWIEHVIDSDVSYIHTFKVADMDLDGDTDVITAEMHQSAERRVSIYLNEGDAQNWTQMVVATTGSHNIRVTDIDNDGDMDIVGANWNNNSPTNGAIELWRNNLRN